MWSSPQAQLVLREAEGGAILCSSTFFCGFLPKFASLVFLWTWDRFFNEIRPFRKKPSDSKGKRSGKKDRGSLRLRLPTQQLLLVSNQSTTASHQLL
jgi:hypothetical protein